MKLHSDIRGRDIDDLGEFKEAFRNALNAVAHRLIGKDFGACISSDVPPIRAIADLLGHWKFGVDLIIDSCVHPLHIESTGSSFHIKWKNHGNIFKNLSIFILFDKILYLNTYD